MGMPLRVRDALNRNDIEALRHMRAKAARTRASNLKRKRAEEARLRDEQATAEDWYAEKCAREAYESDPAFQRRDYLLPDEDLPF